MTSKRKLFVNAIKYFYRRIHICSILPEINISMHKCVLNINCKHIFGNFNCLKKICQLTVSFAWEYLSTIKLGFDLNIYVEKNRMKERGGGCFALNDE